MLSKGLATVIGVVIFIIVVMPVGWILFRICDRIKMELSKLFTFILPLRVVQVIEDMENEKPIRFTAQQLRSATDNFSVILGSGGYGTVYKGTSRNNNIPVAVKVLKGASDKSIEEQFIAEVSTMGRTHHYNLIRLYGFCFESSLIALVYEFMVNGSLDNHLFKSNKGVIIGFEKLHEIAVGTANAISYLHEHCPQRIVHYDIKPANILLDSNFSAKVADFGLAKLCNRDNSHITMTRNRGTPGYAAPELWMPFPVTHKCDVYSFGYPKETMGYYFYFPLENKIVVAMYTELLEKNLLSQEVSGRAKELEEIQDKETLPSENTSKIPMEVEGFEPPQEEVDHRSLSRKTHRDPERLCQN
ncbi:G-type lectin S-receptor-like serine/threonine-protein kinase [Tanacetum coccineum]